MLKYIFGFVEDQEKATYAYGLVYNLLSARNIDIPVLNKDNTVKNAKIKINSIHWYVQDYTPSLERQKTLMNQIVKKMATEPQHSKGSFLMKQVNTQNLWTFELDAQEGINVPIRIHVTFQHIDRQHDLNLNNDTFYRMPVTSAQVVIGSESILIVVFYCFMTMMFILKDTAR